VSGAPKSEFLNGMISVFDRDDLDKHDKLIAVYLIRRGAIWGKASVFQGTIAKETGVSVATVKRSLNRMQEIGFLRVDGSIGQRSKYTLILDADLAHTELGVAQAEPPEQEFAQLTQSEGVAHTELGVAQGELGGSSHRATVPKDKAKYKVKDKEKQNGQPATPDLSSALSALSELDSESDSVEALVRMYNMLDPPDSNNFTRFTSARYREMNAALNAGATYEQIAETIRDIAATSEGPWEVRKEAVKRAKGEFPGTHSKAEAREAGGYHPGSRYSGFFS